MNTLTENSPVVGAASSQNTQNAMALLARLLLATLFVLAGINKIGGMEGTVGYIQSAGLPFAELIYFGTVAIEIVGGLMIAFGFKTRIAGAAMGVFTVLTAVIFHTDFSQQVELTMFMKNLAIAGGMFALAAFGPGRFSIDRS